MIREVPKEVSSEVEELTALLSEVSKKNIEIETIMSRISELNQAMVAKGFFADVGQDMGW